ncbi:MAG: hypothetical protein RID93_13760, partial [Sandaracinaceae bacterium]
TAFESATAPESGTAELETAAAPAAAPVFETAPGFVAAPATGTESGSAESATAAASAAPEDEAAPTFALATEETASELDAAPVTAPEKAEPDPAGSDAQQAVALGWESAAGETGEFLSVRGPSEAASDAGATTPPDVTGLGSEQEHEVDEALEPTAAVDWAEGDAAALAVESPSEPDATGLGPTAEAASGAEPFGRGHAAGSAGPETAPAAAQPGFADGSESAAAPALVEPTPSEGDSWPAEEVDGFREPPVAPWSPRADAPDEAESAAAGLASHGEAMSEPAAVVYGPHAPLSREGEAAEEQYEDQDQDDAEGDDADGDRGDGTLDPHRDSGMNGDPGDEEDPPT